MLQPSPFPEPEKKFLNFHNGLQSLQLTNTRPYGPGGQIRRHQLTGISEDHHRK